MKELFFLVLLVFQPGEDLAFDGAVHSVHKGPEACVEVAVQLAEVIDLENNPEVYIQCMPTVEAAMQ